VFTPPIPPLKPEEVGTEAPSDDLRDSLEKGLLTPNYWPVTRYKLSNPMREDPKYREDPMMEFYPANSGSLSYSEDKTEKRVFVGYKTK